MVAPSRRKDLAKYYVDDRNISIRLACLIFNISITCYYYQPKTADENEQIAKLLTDLTSSYKNWGFKLCFLYLRNVLGLPYNLSLIHI